VIGGALLWVYGTYVAYLIPTMAEHAAYLTFSTAMAAFVLPLTAVVHFVVGLRVCKAGEDGSSG